LKAIILAAGHGKRMRGLCDTLPKPMLPIANRPMVSTTFSRLRSMGITHVGLVVGHEGDRLRELIGDASRFGVDVTYIWQHERLGTGHAVSLCEEFVGDEPFALMWGDVLAHGANYPLVGERYRAGDCDAVLTVIRVPDASRTAAVDVRHGFVAGIVEKPPPGTMTNAFANAGIFVWPPAIFDALRGLELSPRGEIEFTDAIARFVETDHRIAAFELTGYRMNVTDPEACIRANNLLLDEWLAPPPVVAGDATVAADIAFDRAEVLAGASVGPGCTLGPLVSIGEGASIGEHCRIGPNVSVGAGCRVGPGGHLANCIVMADCTIGVGSRLSHTVIDAGAVLGDGEALTGTPEDAVEVLTP
jgi:glucose-1-phosphate thymidylyltransferase